MLKVWILILAGIIFVPLISTITKELEERLEKITNKKYKDQKDDKLSNKEDIEFAIKLLRYGVVILFVIITIIMIRFTSQLIASK